MIGYNCKYAPIELFAGFDQECFLLNEETDSFDYSSSKLYPNMCSHAKAILEEIHRNEYVELCLVNCCDSSRRVYDVLDNGKLKFSCFLDLPTCNNICAVQKLKKELLYLIETYEKYSGKKFDSEKFLNSFSSIDDNNISEKFIAILGARSNKTLKEILKSSINVKIVDLTCAENRDVLPLNVESDILIEDLMECYAKALLSQTPCMRMNDNRRRENLLEKDNCIGIVYHTIKFCDYYDFEYSKIKNLTVPIIKVETDFTNQSYGQLLTRLEGFRESIQSLADKNDNQNCKIKNSNGKYFIGIDSGSTSTELVAIDKNLNVVKSVMVRTGANALVGAKNALSKSRIDLHDVICVVTTGYGRKNIDFADDNVTEITCHAKGAKYLYNDVKTIIDIGGQDSKIISVDECGNVVNFVMNDKCAAGTGRFLENMSKVLELDMDEMANIGLNYKNDLTISSMCTVFAESEIVSLIAENNKIADIVHSLNKSVATKTKTLLNSIKNTENVMMTGGVANNKGVVTEIEKQIKKNIFVPEKPEFCGAIGAAIIASEKYC